MSRDYTNQFELDSVTEVELRPPPGVNGRSYLLIQNNSADSIYLGFDTHGSTNNGIEVPAGQFYERETHPPQNKIYMKGAGAVGARQKILVTEGYSD